MIELFGSAGRAMLPVAGLAILCILLEMWSPKERHSLRSRLFGFLLLVLTPALVILASHPLNLAWQAVGVQPLVDLSPLHPVVAGALLLLIYDFLRYAEHRLEHKILWPVHAVHHSPRELHVANSYAHPLMAVTEFLVVIIPLSLIGQRDIPMAVAGIVAFQNLIIHSPTRFHLGKLRALIVDSRFHRIHHSLEPRHHDRNFGFVFTVWDRLFGTAYWPGDDEWPEVGVAGLDPPRSVGDYLLHPLRHWRRRPSGAAARHEA